MFTFTVCTVTARVRIRYTGVVSRGNVDLKETPSEAGIVWALLRRIE